MEYRSYADLSRLLVNNLWRLPPDVDLVAAIPRSGTVPAAIIAAGLNVPTTDIEGVAHHRPLRVGQTRPTRNRVSAVTDCRHILVVDDSVNTGYNFREARQLLARLGPRLKITYAAVYATPEATRHVDFHFEICPLPRVFEWNYAHQQTMAAACVDIDGVLCLDPREEENDDGPLYIRFLREARPQLQPKDPIYHLVTSRLERYRAQTEDWLHRHGIRFERLSMLDLPDAATRRRLKAHASFKGSIYRDDARATIFLESEPVQAPVIAALSGKPVVCVGDQKLYRPPTILSAPRAGTGGLVQRLLRRLHPAPDPATTNQPA